MGDTVISVENISKKYTITHKKHCRYTTLRDNLSHFGRGFLSRLRSPLTPNPKHIDFEEFWAIKNIDLQIKRGDRVGIIGRNGAGKSTLLKILSRITEPTEGRVTIHGRVASLLEVGTGFHPELTGRENIFLNGAILGMSKREIYCKFDEIVAFAEIEKFLDTPVKRYSSGMYVRLAFAVAAHLEPEILLVDEVLAVGDVEFQKKCIGKMEKVSDGQGRTVLFVSHNMAAIKRLCTKVVLLDKGVVSIYGNSDHVIQKYLASYATKKETRVDLTAMGERKSSPAGFSFTLGAILNSQGEETNTLNYREPFSFIFNVTTQKEFKNIAFHYGIDTIEGIRVFTSDSEECGRTFNIPKASDFRIEVKFTATSLMPGTYIVSKLMARQGIHELITLLGISSFEIIKQPFSNCLAPHVKTGVIRGMCEWTECALLNQK